MQNPGENKAAKKFVNGLLYQRKVQKEAAVAKKKRQVHAIYQRQKKKADKEKEKLEEGSNLIEKKNFKFYQELFKKDKGEWDPKQKRDKEPIRRRNKGALQKRSNRTTGEKDVERKEENRPYKKFDRGEERRMKRIQKMKKYKRRTRRGQPVMKYRINDLFEKIKQEVDGQKRNEARGNM